MTQTRINLLQYDFIDVGSSSGGAIDFAQRKLGWGAGIGIDLDPEKVELAVNAGRNVILGDATKLDEVFVGKTKFAIASHFLEHLPSLNVAISCLISISNHVSEAVCIQQPTFDCSDELSKIGLKLFWTDWSGHKNHMTFKDWRYVINLLVCENKCFAAASLGVAKPIIDTSDSSLIPFDYPRNSMAYDIKDATQYKPNELLKFPLYREIKIIFLKNKNEVQLEDIEYKLGSTPIERW